MTSVVPRSSRALVPAQRRWDPVMDMADLQDRMNQLVQGFFGEGPLTLGAGLAPAWSVPVDIEETDDAYIVDLDLPNVRKEEVQLELRDHTLRVFGEYQQKERAGVLRRQTRHLGQFEFLVVLPGDVDSDKVEAKLADGVLTVRLGKAAASRPRRIDVTSS